MAFLVCRVCIVYSGYNRCIFDPQQRNGMNRNGNGGGGGGGGGSQGGGDSNNSNYGYGYGVNHAQGGREEITFLVPASKCGVSKY